MVTITHIMTDLCVGGKGGLLLPSSGVVPPPLVFTLHLQGLLGLIYKLKFNETIYFCLRLSYKVSAEKPKTDF